MAVKSWRRTQKVFENMTGLLTGTLGRTPAQTQSRKKMSADIKTVATGFGALDKAIGLKGLPRGALTELIAMGNRPDSSGASCLAARMAVRAQRQQQVVTIIDLPHHFDTWLAERCGLAAPELLLVQPETIFEALTTLEKAAQQNGLVIVLTGQTSHLLNHVQPNLLAMLLRRLRRIIQASDSAFLFVTTPLENDPFAPENYPPGFTLPNLAEIRLWIQSENWNYKGSLAVGYKATLAVVKNDLAEVGSGAELRVKFE